MNPHWKWKLMRARQRWEEEAARWANLWRGTRVETRMCPDCRALIGANERRCPFCGEPVPRAASGLGKFLSNVVPQFAGVSYVLLFANVAIYLLTYVLLAAGSSGENLSLFLGGADARSLVALGADLGSLVSQGQVWRLITAIFLHAGILHLAFNCYALVYIGPLLEELLGRERFLFLYLSTGALGFGLSNVYYGGFVPTAGASGAIFGLIGAAILLAYRRSWAAPLRSQLTHWAIYGLIFGFFIGANNAAHVGGLLSGLALASFLEKPEMASAREARFWDWMFRLCLGVIAVSFLASARSYWEWSRALPAL
ncbi:MAG: rhomboid family intramembrane serine protease [Acidobacteria bacterium]|nr:rhomboid family intramembrane serine protease [Acidobacteriota bacterium]